MAAIGVPDFSGPTSVLLPKAGLRTFTETLSSSLWAIALTSGSLGTTEPPPVGDEALLEVVRSPQTSFPSVSSESFLDSRMSLRMSSWPALHVIEKFLSRSAQNVFHRNGIEVALGPQEDRDHLILDRHRAPTAAV